MAIHPLVADYRKRKPSREAPVLIFLNNLFCESVEVDGNTVVRLLRGDVQVVAVDVGAAYLRHIRVPQGCEGTETEKVARLGECLAASDLLGVPSSLEIAKGHDRPSAWDREVVQFHQFFLCQEYDGFLDYLEFGPIYINRGLLGKSFPYRPAEEPFQVGVDFLDRLLCQLLLVSQECKEMIDTVFVEIFIRDKGVELHQMASECVPASDGGVGPLACKTLFRYESVQMLEQGSGLAREFH